MNLYNIIQTAIDKKQVLAVCTIVATKGSTPRKIGAKMLVFKNGEIYGSIGGGNLEKKVIENALKQIELNESKLFKHDLLHQHSMCCGGTVEIFIEPLCKMDKLYIFGAGHTGKSLAEIASHLDFEIYIIDNRKDYLDKISSTENINKLNVDFTEVLHSLPFDKNTYIAILTYEHSIDREILAFCLKKQNAYLGMIGSKRKIELTKKNFIESKIASEAELNKVNMPIGKNINAETPFEIALSILAEIIEIKNNKNE